MKIFCSYLNEKLHANIDVNSLELCYFIIKIIKKFFISTKEENSLYKVDRMDAFKAVPKCKLFGKRSIETDYI